MTVTEKIQGKLIENGMFDSQAKEVMLLVVPRLRKLVSGYGIDLDGQSSAYPDIIHTILFADIKPIALKWIDENIPMAWYRPMFV